MKEFAILKQITTNQKTVTTKKLVPLINAIQLAYIQTSKKVEKQGQTIKRLNGENSKLLAEQRRKKP